MIKEKYADMLTEARRVFEEHYIASVGGIVDKEEVQRKHEEYIQNGLKDELSVEKDYYLDVEIKNLEVQTGKNRYLDWISFSKENINDNDVVVNIIADFTTCFYSPRRERLLIIGHISKYYFLFNEDGELIEHKQEDKKNPPR